MLLSILVVPDAQSQTITLDVPRVVPVSPTATAIEKYQLYPVDYSTGIPGITIPLYEIVTGEVTIPVSLSYHASGLKPKERGGRAGTGWTLNLEPSISREVRGGDDLCTYGWLNNPHADYNPTNQEDMKRYYGELADGIRDTQPDRFTYKLPNGGGSGYFPNKFSFVSIPRNNDKVEYVGGMAITDQDGIKYLFSGPYETAEDHTNGWMCNSVITRWMCSSIKSARDPSRTLASFSYHTNPNEDAPKDSYNLNDKVIIATTRKDSHIRNTLTDQRSSVTTNSTRYDIFKGTGGDALLVPMPDPGEAVGYLNTGFFTSNRISTAYLSTVNFSGNTLSVYYKWVGNNPNKSEVLDAIEVRDTDGIITRTIKFHITPYNANTTLTKLDSIVISAPGVESRTYAFAYHNAYSVPSVLTKGVDHWGFYNGSVGSSGLAVPGIKRLMTFPDVNYGTPFTVLLDYPGANREPSEAYTKTGVLTKITDPRGVITTFDYEGNKGAFRDNSRPYYESKDYLHPVGGLRIKNIQTTDPGTNRKIYTEYTYGLTRSGVSHFTPVWGGGAIKHIVTERDYRESSTHRVMDPYEVHSWHEHLTTYSSMPVSNITFSGGSPVMYNIVNEVIRNSEDNAVKKTTYYYNVKLHNFEDILTWEGSNPAESVQAFLREGPESIVREVARKFPTHPRRPSDDYVTYSEETNQLYGTLERKESLRNSKLALVQKNRYKKVPSWHGDITIDIPHRLVHGNTDPLSLHDVFLFDNDYELEDRVQTTYYLDCRTYNALDKEITTTYYDVNGIQNALETEKNYEYKVDYSGPGFSINPRRVETTNSDNTIIVDSLDYLPGYPGILSRHKRIENNRWTENRILFRPNSPLPERVQSRTDQSPDFREEVRYNAYDQYGNATEIMGKDEMPVTILWGYRARFPVAKIENASIDQVHEVSNAFEDWSVYDEPPQAMWSEINLLEERLPDARVTTYEYKPLQGVTSITDPNNITTKFEYDGYNRLTDSYYVDPSSLQKIMLGKYIYNLEK